MTRVGMLKDEIARLNEMIGLARQLIAIGSAVDLTPVGDGVANLCGLVKGLPEAESSELKNELVQLSTRLGTLGTDIQARIDRPETAGA